jgi:hypothetical protein
VISVVGSESEKMEADEAENSSEGFFLAITVVQFIGEVLSFVGSSLVIIWLVKQKKLNDKVENNFVIALSVASLVYAASQFTADPPKILFWFLYLNKLQCHIYLFFRDISRIFSIFMPPAFTLILVVFKKVDRRAFFIGASAIIALAFVFAMKYQNYVAIFTEYGEVASFCSNHIQTDSSRSSWVAVQLSMEAFIYFSALAASLKEFKIFELQSSKINQNLPHLLLLIIICRAPNFVSQIFILSGNWDMVSHSLWIIFIYITLWIDPVMKLVYCFLYNDDLKQGMVRVFPQCFSGLSSASYANFDESIEEER